MPWSVKAEPLLRDQYASVGAAARAALPVVSDVLQRAGERGVDLGGLPARTRARLANANAFTAAYRRYVWPTSGLDGVRLAPFQLLATEGVTYQARPHAWHLDLADRLGRGRSGADHHHPPGRRRRHRSRFDRRGDRPVGGAVARRGRGDGGQAGG